MKATEKQLDYIIILNYKYGAKLSWEDIKDFTKEQASEKIKELLKRKDEVKNISYSNNDDRDAQHSWEFDNYMYGCY